MSDIDYRLLRAKADLTDDADAALGQSASGYTFVAAAAVGDSGRKNTITVLVEFLDASGAVVTTNRGTYDITVLRRVERSTDDGLNGAVIEDSNTLTSQTGFSPILLDDISPGDEFDVRIENAVNAAATSMRILYREMPQ